MPEKISVLAIDADDDLRVLVRSNPDSVELAAEVLHGDEWHKTIQSAKPDIVIIDISDGSEYSKTLKIAERIKLDFPNTAVFLSSSSKSPDLIISAMRTGAQEFLSKPFNVGEFNRAVDRVAKKKQTRGLATHSGKIVSVFSKKGGVGVTTLAVNIAAALSQTSGKKAAIVDLDLQLGDVSSFLDLRPRYNIADVCSQDDTVDNAKLQSCMTLHQSGILILAEPNHPAESEDITASHINQILTHLKYAYEGIVIDTPHVFDSRVLAALEMSDYILLTTVPNISSVRATRRVLDLFREMGYSKDKIRVVINRVNKSDSISPDDIQKTLDYPITWAVPNNYPAVVDAINTGMPLVGQKRLSNVGKSILEFAEAMGKWSQGNGESKAK